MMQTTDEFNGRVIRKARRGADLTQAELAKLAGLNGGQTQISKIERDDQDIPSWRRIEKVRRALQIKD